MGPVPLVSCVMPTYGRPDYVNESVAMFLAQDYPHKELIILNDCSGQHFTVDFPNVRVINEALRYPTIGDKRNSCVSMANGSVIAVWDDDDVYLPWRLSFSVSEMVRLNTPFYRPADYWAYWGSEKLHDNQSVPGWPGHAYVTFTKDLWCAVDGYPAMNIGQDAGFFERVHSLLGKGFIRYDLAQADRFGILRGTSQYEHVSIDGGRHPLDTAPGSYTITPTDIRDPVLRAAHGRLVNARPRTPGFDQGRCIPLLTS